MGELLTGQEANEELGDDYYADLDFIKTIEKAKEGYESEIADDSEDSSSGGSNLHLILKCFQTHSLILNSLRYL